MQVFRVENGAGIGPYCSGVAYALGQNLYDAFTHPDPKEDGLEEVSPAEYFGFASLGDLMGWFGRAATELAAYGFEVAVYEAQSVRRGGRQCVFEKHTARLVERRPLPA